MNEKSKQAKEYTSFNQLKADRFKHRRVNNEVQDKFKVPVTFNQSLGFHVHDQQQKEIAKQERKFQAPRGQGSKCLAAPYA